MCLELNEVVEVQLCGVSEAEGKLGRPSSHPRQGRSEEKEKTLSELLTGGGIYSYWLYSLEEL